MTKNDQMREAIKSINGNFMAQDIANMTGISKNFAAMFLRDLYRTGELYREMTKDGNEYHYSTTMPADHIAWCKFVGVPVNHWH